MDDESWRKKEDEKILEFLRKKNEKESKKYNKD